MGTVLWANYLLSDGRVVSDERDLWALFEYAEELDKLAQSAGLEPFSSLMDYTDMELNLGDELPEGIVSTDERMAAGGVWKSAEEALSILEGLLAFITERRPELGILAQTPDDLAAELEESIEYARKAQALGARFNFAVVM